VSQPPSPSWSQLLDDAALLSFEHQLHLADVLGNHSWYANFDEQRFEFTGDHPLVCTRFHMLGSAAPGPQSWLWSWANPTNYPPELTALAESLRDFGQQHGIGELANGEIPFTALGSSIEPAQVAWMMTEAAKAVSGSMTAYTADAGGGTRIAVLIEHPDLLPPPPEPSRVMRVLQQGTTELPLSDPRRAMHSYAIRRQLSAQFSDDGTQMWITGSGIEIAIRFNERGLIVAMSGSLGARR
jgi:hypothetical protein